MRCLWFLLLALILLGCSSGHGLPQHDFVFGNSSPEQEATVGTGSGYFVSISSAHCVQDLDCQDECFDHTVCRHPGDSLKSFCAINCANVCAINAECSFKALPESTAARLDQRCQHRRSAIQCTCPKGYHGNPEVFCLRNDDDNEGTDSVDTFQETENLRDLVDQSTDLSTMEYESSMHDFSQAMFFKIIQDNPDNVVFSPMSLHTALGMLTSGATDNSTTQAQLLDALGRSQSIQWLENLYKGLLHEYQTNATHALYIGNAAWIKHSLVRNISGKYSERLDSIYKAQLRSLGENPEESTQEVNQWVKSVTQGRIEKLIENLDPDTVFLLTNAIYFKNAWTVAFTPMPTPIDFKLANDQTVQVPMMVRSSYEFVLARFKLNQILPHVTFTAVSIPYEFQSGRFEMILLMPDTPKGLTFLTDFVSTIHPNENIFDQTLKQLKAAEVFSEERTLRMPPFIVQSSISAQKYLQEIGVQDAFDPSAAEFDPIGPRLSVSKVSHVATVEVTTEGTVGAAATGIEVVPLIGLIDSPTEVTVDKPFIFVIRDTHKKSVLFVGKVTDPSSKN